MTSTSTYMTSRRPIYRTVCVLDYQSTISGPKNRISTLRLSTMSRRHHCMRIRRDASTSWWATNANGGINAGGFTVIKQNVQTDRVASLFHLPRDAPSRGRIPTIHKQDCFTTGNQLLLLKLGCLFYGDILITSQQSAPFGNFDC